MRQRYFGIVVAVGLTLGPAAAWGGDREIADQIIERLNQSRNTGQLKDFTIDMKVDAGVVLFRGTVAHESQKGIVLGAATGIDGIAQVIDEVHVAGAAVAPDRAAQGDVPQPQPEVGASENVQPIPADDSHLSRQEPVAAETESLPPDQPILQTTAYDAPSDQQVVSQVVAALQEAQRSGRLRGFGVDVKSRNGVLQLTGRAASASQREQIVRIAEGVPGVSGIREAITIPSSVEESAALNQPPVESPLTPLAPPAPLMRPAERVSSHPVAGPHRMPARAVPYRRPAGGMPPQSMPVSTGVPIGAPVMGQPVPMAPHSPVGAPRYDSPNLPNYAWPGYAAYPNYAALTYPQQYSPTAWPYIGPFYPYPQVPLGWRKVSLEWDDGWWFLDFTDK